MACRRSTLGQRRTRSAGSPSSIAQRSHSTRSGASPSWPSCYAASRCVCEKSKLCGACSAETCVRCVMRYVTELPNCQLHIYDQHLAMPVQAYDLQFPCVDAALVPVPSLSAGGDPLSVAANLTAILVLSCGDSSLFAWCTDSRWIDPYADEAHREVPYPLGDLRLPYHHCSGIRSACAVNARTVAMHIPQGVVLLRFLRSLARPATTPGPLVATGLLPERGHSAVLRVTAVPPGFLVARHNDCTVRVWEVWALDSERCHVRELVCLAAGGVCSRSVTIWDKSLCVDD
eukprot:TRINITY_DN3177_c0_g1_i3.p1 TRINITY_DN3177_c0_g1~~TRINITY_DN3177_c0_g1_i3.p1  ORF type:complete len:288 (+),score=41.94 TRINITY_DN3177_c0_g1_i3:624-1487(+)